METGPESTADSFLAYQRMTFVNTASLLMDTSEIFYHNPLKAAQFSETWPDAKVDDPTNFRAGPVNTCYLASWRRVLSMFIQRAS